MAIKKTHKSKKMRSILWLLAALCCIVLLVSAMYYKENGKCNGVSIVIGGDNQNYFVNKSEIYNVVKKYGGDSSAKNSIETINLKQIEQELKKIIWIQSAELYFDNNNVLKIIVKENIPVARVFTEVGTSFYLDSILKVLPINPKQTVKLPVFTGFLGNGSVFAKADSSTLADIKRISLKIMADSFLMAMIEQVNILPDNNFEMIPKVGHQTILIGDANNVESKFEKLKLFYKKITPVVGWNKYSKINLQYDNQIVTSIKGIDEVISDSIRTLELMKYVAEIAAIKSGDSTQVFEQDIVKKTEERIIAQSAEREDEGEEGNVTSIKVAKPKLKIVKPTASNAIVKKQVGAKQNAIAKPIKPLVKPVPKPLEKTLAKKAIAKPVVKPKQIAKKK